MAATNEVILTGDWVKVVDDGFDFTIQQVSIGQVQLKYATAPPANDDTQGITLSNGKGISSVTFGQGTVYARGMNQKIIVTV